jgi:hypothetical protein
MKKILTIISLATLVAASSNAQGLVNFNNTSAAGTKISTNSVVGGASSGLAALNTGNASFYYALFYSTTQTSVSGSTAAITGITGSTYAFNASGWTAGATATNGATRAGQVAGNAAQAIAGIAGAGTGNFVVVGWSANIGTQVSDLISWYNNGSPATAGFIGESSVTGTLTLGDGAGVSTPSPFGTAAPFAPGFVLGLVAPTPEPGTMVLAGLGGLALLGLRRKK